MTKKEFQELTSRMGSPSSTDHRDRPVITVPRRVIPKLLEGPLSVRITLHGKCPSKKNLWQIGQQAGSMFLDAGTQAEIDSLTTQAIFGWGGRAPVESPDITVKFFVNHARRDRDGMFVTLLDCLQCAGVLVNDNLRWNNGRTILEPAEFVKAVDERAEVLIERRACAYQE